MKLKAVARVQVTVELDAGIWGEDCSIDQLYRQAAASAVGDIAKACKDSNQKFRLIGTRVLGVITEEQK